MNKNRLWLTIGVVTVAFVAGGVVAQEGLRYPYLPAEYSEPLIPTKAEWRELSLSAELNYEGALTEKLVRTHFDANVMPEGLIILVDTKTQPSWNVYRGNDRWSCSDRELRAAYEEAADSTSSASIMPWVRLFFAGIADNDVEIRFHIKGGPVGTWTDGIMTLAGEE